MSSHQGSSDLSTILFGDSDAEPPSNPVLEHAAQPVQTGPTHDRLAVEFTEMESASDCMASWASNSMDWGPLASDPTDFDFSTLTTNEMELSFLNSDGVPSFPYDAPLAPSSHVEMLDTSAPTREFSSLFPAYDDGIADHQLMSSTHDVPEVSDTFLIDPIMFQPVDAFPQLCLQTPAIDSPEARNIDPRLIMTTQYRSNTTELAERPSVEPKKQESVPTVRGHKRLPPARRGGRRGKLSKEQMEAQKEARLRGVCIRCRRTRIKCSGGIPCQACLQNASSRLWNKPCVKAHFLDIIESAPIFESATRYREAVLRGNDMECTLKNITILIHHHAATQKVLRCSFFPNSMNIKGDGEFHKPTPSKLQDIERDIVNIDPSGGLVRLPLGPDCPDKFRWVALICAFCGNWKLWYESGGEFADLPCRDIPTDQVKAVGIKAARFLRWFCSRYLEICLFRYLQKAANNPPENTADQKVYIYCIFSFFLVARSSIGNPLASDSPSMNPEMRDFDQSLADRIGRVRKALWVYASITIQKLPPWTDFWHNLPGFVAIVAQENLPRLFQDSLTNFDEGLQKIEDAAENRLRELDTPSDFDFVRSLKPRTSGRGHTGTLDKLHMDEIELCITSYTNPARYPDMIGKYKKKLREALWFPQTKEGQTAATFFVFGDLIQTASDMLSNKKIGIVVRKRQMQMALYRRLGDSLSESGLAEEQYFNSLPSQPSASYLLVHLDDSPIKEPIPAEFMAQNLRSGKRWTQISDILGPGILLAGNSFLFVPMPLLVLDIATIVGLGSDDEFDLLRELLRRKDLWLKAICAKLGNFVDNMVENIIDSNPRRFARSVTGAIKSTFGDHVLQQGYLIAPNAGIMRAAAVFKILYEVIPKPSRVNRQAWPTLAALVESVWLGMMDLPAHNPDNDAESYLRSAIDASLERFTDYCRSSQTEQGVGAQSALNITRVRVGETFSIFVEMMHAHETSASHLDLARLAAMLEAMIQCREGLASILM